MNVIDKSFSKIRSVFNTIAQSDTAQGAAIGASFGFSVSLGNPTAAAVGGVIGALAGAENLKTLFNAAVYGKNMILQLVPIPVGAKAPRLS
ncbi:MAG TPA: hypothetical protein VEF76_13660 [Patescibacteria group bacterium]|nr:hypothetical protein [Patescibacteria group bacterium]